MKGFVPCLALHDQDTVHRIPFIVIFQAVTRVFQALPMLLDQVIFSLPQGPSCQTCYIPSLWSCLYAVHISPYKRAQTSLKRRQNNAQVMLTIPYPEFSLDFHFILYHFLAFPHSFVDSLVHSFICVSFHFTSSHFNSLRSNSPKTPISKRFPIAVSYFRNVRTGASRALPGIRHTLPFLGPRHYMRYFQDPLHKCQWNFDLKSHCTQICHSSFAAGMRHQNRHVVPQAGLSVATGNLHMDFGLLLSKRLRSHTCGVWQQFWHLQPS